jgi:hypothetical protein
MIHRRHRDAIRLFEHAHTCMCSTVWHEHRRRGLRRPVLARPSLLSLPLVVPSFRVAPCVVRVRSVLRVHLVTPVLLGGVVRRVIGVVHVRPLSVCIRRRFVVHNRPFLRWRMNHRRIWNIDSIGNAATTRETENCFVICCDEGSWMAVSDYVTQRTRKSHACANAR